MARGCFRLNFMNYRNIFNQNFFRLLGGFLLIIAASLTVLLIMAVAGGNDSEITSTAGEFDNR